jgi:bifunctional non-homologous end joining protein LigD
VKKSQLTEYSAKRSFSATPEPAAAVRDAHGGPLLFVIQQHAARHMHYDLRLECDGVLKSWAIPKGPSLDPNDKRLAAQTEDHPYEYASFEGVIPPGQYGAGEMIVWDCGVYSPDEGQQYSFHDRAQAEERVRTELENGKLSFLLRGEKVKGSFALVRMADRKNWLLIKHKDRFVAKTDLTAQNRSVLSNASVEEMKSVPAHRIAAERLVVAGPSEKLPATLAPMQAELGDTAFNHTDWMWEPKLDGYRVLAFVEGDTVKLRTRRGLDLATDFPKVCAELRKQAVETMILDAEIVAFDAEGRPSFNAMQNRSAQTERAVLYCFDLLHFAGVNLRQAPYTDRRRYLVQSLLPSPLVQLVHSQDDGVALQAAADASGLEGVVGKRKNSRYEAGKRSASWLKVKSITSADFVIGGYSQGKGARSPLGSLLVGYWDGGKLVYASHVGSGFNDESLSRVREQLEPLQTKTNPFSTKPELNAPTTWVAPELVAEVKFQDWTEDGHLRAPVFLRLRDDIDSKTVRREVTTKSAAVPASTSTARGRPKASSLRLSGAARDTQSANSEIDDVLRQLDNVKATFPIAVGPHTLKLTHLDRVYWPADQALSQAPVTKRDLLRYFAQVSPFILPHLAGRPLTMIRMPDGIHGQRFFQKHWEQERPPFARTITVFSEHKDESHEYLLCNNLPTLLWLAQSGTLEFHVWHSRAQPGPDTKAQTDDYSSSAEALETSVLNHPDYVVFDIDPYIYSGKEKAGDEPELNTIAFEKGKEVAFWLRELLDTMSLEAIVKTSGKTGLHVFVPIKRTIDFDAARAVSEIVGRHLMRQHPKDITMEWSVPKRTGKIFMDYNMNVRGKTLNVAYSPRGAAGAPVSMPLTWDELAGAHPLDFRLANAPQRLAQNGDRWRDVLKMKQSIERALKI